MMAQAGDPGADRGYARRIAMLVLVALLALVSWSTPLDSAAEERVDSMLTRALVTFATARALDGVISVLQSGQVGAQVGVGMSIQPGELLDPIEIALGIDLERHRLGLLGAGFHGRPSAGQLLDLSAHGESSCLSGMAMVCGPARRPHIVCRARRAGSTHEGSGLERGQEARPNGCRNARTKHAAANADGRDTVILCHELCLRK